MIEKKVFTKHFRLVKIFLILILLLSGFITPIINNYYLKNWQTEVEKIKSEIKEKINIEIENKFEVLKNAYYFYSENNFKNLTQDFEHNNIVVTIFNKEYQLISWTNNYVNVDIQSITKKYKPGEYFIYSTPSLNLLSFFERKSDKIISISIPLEKKYKLNSKFFKSIDTFQPIETDYLTEVEIIPDKSLVEDGRKTNFILYNNFNNQIASVSFVSPSRDGFITSISNKIFFSQSILLIFILILWGFDLKKYLKHFENEFLSTFVFSVYLILFRIILLAIGFPSNYVSGILTDPASFSSTFAFGITKSPLELSVTILFVFMILRIVTLQMAKIHWSDKGKTNSKILSIFLVIISTVVFLLVWRAFGATIKSFVFDSSLRFFKESEFIPEISLLVMEINLFFVGFGIMWSALIILFIIRRVLINTFYVSSKNYLWILIIVLQIAGVIFDLLQKQPQGNLYIRIIFIFGTILFLERILKEQKFQVISILYLLLFSSFISIVFLIHHNSALEKKSLKTISNEVTRSNESFIKYSVFKFISDAGDNNELKKWIKKSDINFDEEAFVLWSNSDFEKQPIISNVNIIDADKKLLGSFAFQYKENFIWDWSEKDDELKGQRIITLNTDEGTKTIRGIIPLRDRNNLLGYLEVSSIIDLNSIGIESIPPIFSSSNLFSNSAIDINQLRIFDFQNGELKNYFTDIILPNHAIKSILNSKFNKSREGWTEISINNNLHTFFIKEIKQNGITRILAIGKEEKSSARYLFDFFKIFFVHTILILILITIYFGVKFRKGIKFNFSFRLQLLLAFTIISLLPLIFLAFYFRTVTNEKNISSIYYKLAKRADSIENYIQKKNNGDLPSLFNSAAEDLDINYSVFENKNLVFSTKQEYYNAGLIPKIINSFIYNSIILGEQQEYVIEENIDNYRYHSLYHKTNINGNTFIIKISDLFNQIQLPMKGSEIDVFFFGIYSFTIIMLIFMSVFLANQISNPIRKLTKSMNSVGAGDLNVELNIKAKGEIEELVEGFNKMVKHLKKNQSELAELERETAWKEMAKQVAHEIKNPLTPMKLSIQQLIAAKNDNSPKFDEYFSKITETIIKQIDNLKNIASEFSNFARMPSLQVKKCEMIALINNSIDIFNDEQIEIKHITDLSNAYVNIDAEEFQRMMINLIRNSIQANANNIHVYSLIAEKNLIIKVCDDGVGITKENVNKIFNANFTTKKDGMGLGLFLAKRFVESMHGSIKLIEYKNYKTTIEIVFTLINE